MWLCMQNTWHSARWAPSKPQHPPLLSSQWQCLVTEQGHQATLKGGGPSSRVAPAFFAFLACDALLLPDALPSRGLLRSAGGHVPHTEVQEPNLRIPQSRGPGHGVRVLNQLLPRPPLDPPGLTPQRLLLSLTLPMVPCPFCTHTKQH